MPCAHVCGGDSVVSQGVLFFAAVLDAVLREAVAGVWLFTCWCVCSCAAVADVCAAVQQDTEVV